MLLLIIRLLLYIMWTGLCWNSTSWVWKGIRRYPLIIHVWILHLSKYLLSVGMNCCQNADQQPVPLHVSNGFAAICSCIVGVWTPNLFFSLGHGSLLTQYVNGHHKCTWEMVSESIKQFTQVVAWCTDGRCIISYIVSYHLLWHPSSVAQGCHNIQQTLY